MNKKKQIGIIILVMIVALFALIAMYVITNKRDTSDVSTISMEPAEQDYAPWIGNEAMTEIEDWNRENAPDVYLRNKTPVIRPSFSMDSYIDHKNETYVFTVIPKIDSLQIVQQDVYDWLTDIGLTGEQIESLVIEYTGQIN